MPQVAANCVALAFAPRVSVGTLPGADTTEQATRTANGQPLLPVRASRREVDGLEDRVGELASGLRVELVQAGVDPHPDGPGAGWPVQPVQGDERPAELVERGVKVVGRAGLFLNGAVVSAHQVGQVVMPARCTGSAAVLKVWRASDAG